MHLDIEYKGTEHEQKYMKKLIAPFETDKRATRNHYLDILVLGEKEVELYIRGESNNTVPVVLEVLKSNSKPKLYLTKGVFVEVLYDDYIKKLSLSNSIDDKIVFLLTPKVDKLTFHGDVSKVKVYTADENSTLFGYAIGDRHPQDIPFMVKMFYNPKK